MPELLIRCPVTGRDVHTGVALPVQVFESAELPPRTIGCPFCGQKHTWSKKEAYLQFPPERGAVTDPKRF